jgi:integrase
MRKGLHPANGGHEMREILTAKMVASSRPKAGSKSGRYCDGGGLYLYVREDKEGRIFRSWTFRWRDRITGKLREKGLGRYGKHDVTLSKARERAGECREMVRTGSDPLANAHQKRTDAALARSRMLTFQDCTDRYISAHKAEWTEQHATQFSRSLETYATTLMPLPVADIALREVMACLEPHWLTTTATAKRVRGRIESILDWATVHQYRSGENPARWRGHLEVLLPKPEKISTVKHFKALDYQNMGSFMLKLRANKNLSARSLEFLILTAARAAETAQTPWSEINLKERVWTISAARMKSGREHTVPLSSQAVALLEKLPRVCDYVFPARSLDKGITDTAMLKMAKHISGDKDLTQHGFRSAFTDWARDCTNHSHSVREHALAHVIPDRTEAAYARSDMFAKRARLMTAWSDYCDQLPGDSAAVTPIRKEAKS